MSLRSDLSSNRREAESTARLMSDGRWEFSITLFTSMRHSRSAPRVEKRGRAGMADPAVTRSSITAATTSRSMTVSAMSVMK